MNEIETRIQELESTIASLNAQRAEQVNMVTAFPGRDAWTLRENYRNEENRRSGLLGIDQAIAGAKQQLVLLRQMQTG